MLKIGRNLRLTLQYYPQMLKSNSTHLNAGNLVGTLFNKDAAQKFKEQHLKAKQQQEVQDKEQPKADNTAPRDMATNAREASRVLQSLSSEQREQLLHKIADNLLAKEEEIMQENDKDCQVMGCLHCVCIL